MKYQDLREFINILEKNKELKKISLEINPHLEMTEITDRVLKKNGPALLFENPKNFNIPVLCNLFGTVKRVAMGMGQNNVSGLREIGHLLSFLKEPEPPKNLRDILKKLPHIKKIFNMKVKLLKQAPCHEEILKGNEVDLSKIPIMKNWPKDIAPLITWGVTITKGPHQQRQNLGIYRQQVIEKNKIIIRWLSNRGGAFDFQAWSKKYPKKNFPVTVALGLDPATLLSAVTPIPDSMSEYAFSGLLRGKSTKVIKCVSNDLQVPCNSEIVLEGHIKPGDFFLEGPYGDHTGYYNEKDKFPVLTITHLTKRHNAIYHSTYTGRPPDEPSILSMALNEVFIPILQKKFTEIIDFYLPPEGCSYRLAIITIKKQYPGHARIIMMGIWSYLKQFMYTKFLIVCDDDIDARNWNDIIWAITTRVDPKRDVLIIENTPIDYLDFASPVSGLGSKMGIDATNKWPGETFRTWGEPILKDRNIKQYIDQIWDQLKL